MIDLGNVIFSAEILLAELMFLFPVEKRHGFVWRYPAAVIAALSLSQLLTMPRETLNNPWLQLLRFLVLFGLTVAAMGVCFRMSFPSLLAGCVAGYAVQHIAYQVMALVSHSSLLSGVSIGSLSRSQLLEFLVFPPVYLLLFVTAGLYAARHEWHKEVNVYFYAVSLTIVFICVGLNRFTRYFGDFGSISVSLYSITCCVLALIVQFVLCYLEELRREKDTVRLLWQEERKQYEISKKTIETINIKYHDLKHKLAALRGRLPEDELDSIETAVKVYGSQIKTGNDALDVLLTENSLRCIAENITMTCTGNGADLSFVNIMDVYSLFGNAVENAIEAARRLDDPEKKVIDIVIERMGSMLSISIVNFFTGEMVWEDGLPTTTKTEDRGFHGFGMKSMRLIAEKYGGSLTAEVERDLFSLGIFLMAQ